MKTRSDTESLINPQADLGVYCFFLRCLDMETNISTDWIELGDCDHWGNDPGNGVVFST